MNSASNFYLVISSDRSSASEPGKHWFIILKTGKGSYELFDSLGTSRTFVTEKVRLPGQFKFNTTPLQADSSSTCGQFCVYYIVHRLHNLDLCYVDFLNDFFCELPSINETRITNFWSRYGPQ